MTSCNNIFIVFPFAIILTCELITGKQNVHLSNKRGYFLMGVASLPLILQIPLPKCRTLPVQVLPCLSTKWRPARPAVPACRCRIRFWHPAFWPPGETGGLPDWRPHRRPPFGGEWCSNRCPACLQCWDADPSRWHWTNPIKPMRTILWCSFC